MPSLKVYLDKECTQEIFGDTIDSGEWDLEKGAEIKVYLKNTSSILMAKCIKSTHSDPRTTLTMPEQIRPGEVAEVRVGIPPFELRNDEDEEQYFVDLFEQLSGEWKWMRV